MIVFLNDFKPLKNAGFECLVRLILGFMLNIKDWGQVTVSSFTFLMKNSACAFAGEWTL